MTKDEALEIALEALELHGKQYPHMVKGYCLDAITAIKKSLETKDEPVYWEMPDGKIVDKWGLQFYRGDTGTPLYTTPQPKQKPLTDEQIRNIAKQYALSLAFPSNSQTTPEMFARAIEVAHGIKELA
jgi:hypothetical protein